MFKKNSWIVALLTALSFSALFTGCADAIDPGPVVTYTEVELGAFNIWGGQAYQQGWAVAGMKFLGVGDKAETAADKGYKNEDFDKATKLVVEMADDTHPSGSLDIIWGGEDADGSDEGIGGWNQTNGISYKKEGNTITIDLTKMKNYTTYRSTKIAKRKLVLQAGGESGKLEKLVVKAKLLIPDIEEPIPPDPEAIPGQGKYTFAQLDQSEDEVAIDLNTAKIGALTPSEHYPDASLTAAALTVKFDWNTQNIFIPFDDYVKPLIVNAAAGGYSFDVTIKGNATGTGLVRVALGLDSTSGWNVSSLQNVNFNTLASAAGTTTNFTLSGAANNLNGIVIQGRPLNNANSEGVDLNTITINSITIKLVAPTTVNTVSSITITVPAPTAGLPATTSVSGTGWSGAVTWVPALPADGKFATSTTYYANIVISAAPRYIISQDPDVLTIKVNGTDVVAYNPATRTATSAYFPQTSPKPALLPDGVLFDLTEWLKTNTTIGWPLQQSGGPQFTVNETGITIANIVNSWDALDVLLDKVNDQIDPSLYKIKVVAKGKILTMKDSETAGMVKIGGATGSYSEIAKVENVEVNTEFTLTCNEIPSGYMTSNSKAIRFQTDQTKATSFTITSIVITNEGAR